MGALNFDEIPAANAGPQRDAFELFGREFLIFKGLHPLAGPDRGPDGGRDLIFEEIRRGPLGFISWRWLVSCKHYSRTGKAIGPGHEPDITDRLRQHRCDGFIGFYSTIPTSGLAGKLEQIPHILFDPESIERDLLDSRAGHTVALRFMPVSMQAWLNVPGRGPAFSLSDSASESQSGSFHDVISGRYFLSEPIQNLASGLEQARERNVPAFVLIYANRATLRDRFAWAVGHFMDYEIVRHLVHDNFVTVVISGQQPDVADLVPADDPLEVARWVVLSPGGQVMRSERLCPDPAEGLKRVQEAIQQAAQAPWRLIRQNLYAPRQPVHAIRAEHSGACMAILRSSRGVAWALVDREGLLVNFDGWYTPLPERTDPKEDDRRSWIANGYDYPSLVNWETSFAHELEVVKLWPLP